MVTGKATYITTFSDASPLGAGMIGYASTFDGENEDSRISGLLRHLSELASSHPSISPRRVEAPDEELRALEERYRASFDRAK